MDNINPMTQYLTQYFDEVTPHEFYRDLFPSGELQEQGVYDDGKCNAIIVQVTDKKKEFIGKNGNKKLKSVVKRYTLTDGLEVLDDVIDSDFFSLVAPLSYVGKERTADNARYAYGVAVDLDDLIVDGDRPTGLRNLFHQIEYAKRIPNPTYIVSSGTGLHLYYMFEKAIPLYKNTREQLQQFKHELTWLCWDDGTIVDIGGEKKKIQYEGIYQGFRVVGTITKNGARARAFSTGTKVDIDYLNQFVDYKIKDITYKSELTLEEAKARYPEWYEKVIINNDHKKKEWHVSRNLYDWWLKEIKRKAQYRRRYFCLWTLAIYAVKCSYYDEKHNPNPVTYEELENDCFELLPLFESKTEDEDNHFTEGDVLDALEGFQEKFYTYPKSSIAYKTGIDIKTNKRNGRKQTVHLERARAVQAIDYPNGEWHNKEGRPLKQIDVRAWQYAHPNGKKADCIRDTGLSKPTVYKWWVDDL